MIALAAVAGAAVSAPTFAAAQPPHTTPPHAQPSVASIQKQLGELVLKNSQLVESYDRAKVVVQRREQAALNALAARTKARAVYHEARQQFAQIIQSQYESDDLGAAGALLDSTSGTNYLDRLATLNMVSTHIAQVVETVSAARDTATRAATTASRLFVAASNERNAIARQRRDIEARIQKYKELLATLTAQQQWLFQRMTNPSLSSAAVASLDLTRAPSPAAQRAVKFALNQVGKPYVFGAAGPSTYDCSGLTMAAWRAGGVKLPHSAAEQYNYGHHVAQSDLRPGDLIFFYQPIDHVTIYIGDGLMVSAPTEGEDVSVVPVSAFGSSYTGATHLTG